MPQQGTGTKSGSAATSTADFTTGRWPWILIGFGIDEAFLRDRHGPCPMCGGSDRFRFDDKKGRGTWFCNQCGNGDGFDLLEKCTGLPFKELAEQINKLRITAPDPAPFKRERSVEDRRDRLNQAWAGAKSPLLVDNYFRQRGLTAVGDLSDVRGHMALEHYDKGSNTTAKWPTICALIRNRKGEPTSVHRTVLLPDAQRKKTIMPPTEKLVGGAIRLVPVQNDLLLVAEGIETALAGREFFWRAWKKVDLMGVWATVSAHMMKEVELPTVKSIIVCADADRSYTGQAAAFELARKLKLRKDCPTIWVALPDRQGCDMVDALTGDCGVTWTHS